MKNLTLVLLFILLIILMSCNSEVVTLPAGQCLQEVNKQYRDASKTPSGIIYKIESVTTNAYVLSTWQDNSWIYLQNKPFNYFNETQKFVYNQINCPTVIDYKGAVKETY